ncbi:hypothetical protein FRB94_013533 [Tulasnella sp. JGI-2019a]|nr:hypothetical protein FRB94_013533 [Tulasnella sp. JGI-2019a]
MTNWMDPMTMMAEAAIFNKIVIAFLGLFAWEIVVTLWFDLEVLLGQRAFKWPMIFYWASKYSMFFANIGVTIAENVTTELNCEALYAFNQLMGNVAIGAASTLLMIRTIAVWSRNPIIMYPLIVLSLGQWAILLHSCATVSASWSAAQSACAIKAVPTINLQVLYLYTMCFDFLVLFSTTVGLFRMPGRQETASGNRLWTLLFKDGLVFFLVAFSSNLVAVIFVLADFNPVMDVIASVPAASITAIVSCRLFVRLNTYNDVQNSGFNSSYGRKKQATSKPSNHRLSVRKPDAFSSLEDVDPSAVHVKMETFTTDIDPNNHSTPTLNDLESQHEKARGPSHSADVSPDGSINEKSNMDTFMPM